MKYLLYVIIFVFIIITCKKNSIDSGNGVAPPSSVYPEIDFYAAWSPDGSFIVYYYNGIKKVNAAGLYHVERDSIGLYFISPTHGKKQLFLKGSNTSPSWSPCGEWIAYVKDAHIYKVKVDGDSVVKLTSEGKNFFPSWSPDGNWIAYDSNTNDPDGNYAIWKMMADGTNKTDISEHGVGGWRMPNWSPDGKKIIHQRYIGVGAPEIVIMDTSGQNPIRLTFDSHHDRHPEFSPDGRKIVFNSQKETGGPSQIYLMNSDGSHSQQLTRNGGNYPAWSPDGKYIVYTRYNSAEFSNKNGHLWIMDSNGENKRQLTYLK